MPPSDPLTSKPDRGDGLGSFLVIDRLEVGPPRIDPDRVSAAYRVFRNDTVEQLDLTYRYQEAVFEPGVPASDNLASMLVAQLALNYGLFCREIVFHGTFDPRDRRFLSDMAANTAREIYVKKLLEPNPFLLPGFAELTPQKRPNYLQAQLRFEPAESPTRLAGWVPSPDRFAVLSSGGKDSLLSYGLLRELGRESHPIFLNESGRHWFTALNAYRHFEKAVGNTARVWTNSDRLFSWMLRHLPFVRPDFHRLRSDEYPIRLWTVAVFLFGALPLLRKRHIGRLVIGDEYDTTVKKSHQGITHYDGLFDQSIYFDRAMTRFFLAKGWGVTQFSMLRSLSEFLIEGTLARRYPDLLRLQVSCHAAHEESGLIRPCGRCEKCRRIVGMLLAAEADPTTCGYRERQIQTIRRDLVEKGVHQERVAVEHLASILFDKAEIAEPRIGSDKAARRREVVSLRFHSERSPIDGLPLAIREPLYDILLEHAEGALQRIGNQWVDLDLRSDPGMSAPYPFDKPPAVPSKPENTRTDQGPTSINFGELTWPEAEDRLKKVDIALLPVGAIEQHGPHLPIDTDSFDAEYIARRVAEACSEPAPVVLPLIPYGVSYHHDDFPGTLSVGNESLARYVYDVGMSAARNGIAKLIIVNGHGGNAATLHFAAQMINRDARIFTCVDTGETSDSDIFALAETSNDVHAGEIETSTSLATRPHLVKMDLAQPFVPRFSSHYLDFTSRHSVDWYARTARISESGVFGDPTKATREKGEMFLDLMIRHLVALVDHLKGLSLEEIHQQKV